MSYSEQPAGEQARDFAYSSPTRCACCRGLREKFNARSSLQSGNLKAHGEFSSLLWVPALKMANNGLEQLRCLSGGFANLTVQQIKAGFWKICKMNVKD